MTPALDLPRWVGPAHHRRYPRGRGPAAKRRQFWCPEGCVPAQLATLYDDLPWTYMVTLSAPEGQFQALWNAWGPQALTSWEKSTADPAHPERGAIWLLTFAWQKGKKAGRGLPLPEIVQVPVPGPGPVSILSPDGQGEDIHGIVRGVISPDDSWEEPARRLWVERRIARRRDWMRYHGEAHAHLVIGNVPRADIWAEVSKWPGSRDVTKITMKAGGHWAALHYCLAQTKDKRFHRDDHESYCDHLMEPPRWSENSDALLAWRLAAIERTRESREREGALKASGNMTPAQRSARARHAANVRHAKRRAAP